MAPLRRALRWAIGQAKLTGSTVDVVTACCTRGPVLVLRDGREATGPAAG
jgi:hypothetical protein